jgi:hypothetical protein
LAIVASSLKLVIDSYLTSTSPADLLSLSKNIDMAFTIIFATELALKAIAYGFVLDDNSYLRESWS